MFWECHPHQNKFQLPDLFHWKILWLISKLNDLFTFMTTVNGHELLAPHLESIANFQNCLNVLEHYELGLEA